MKKSDKYTYKFHLLTMYPYKPIEIHFESIIGQLLCRHEYGYFVREEKNSRFHSLRGDTIEHICYKCGKSKGTMLWEYEGMGYK